ncbi:SMI1/KNR4 family protein [Nonomuraea zeae]|uniref:Knr4/Smi1-like domain-containing protein n=1 Tax=Nonomuraea zeae TaxID=1642303 RepID=A0A5S4G8T4_9ACTN|nr:SMI1/KNR4 family protein [Nonomuraea zeae]TMR29259.1 hypothetical protein ETD85_33130 [Nonomuraea zeae]
MLKLVRLALTAAIVTAIALRLRRRARMQGTEPALPATAQGSGTRRAGRRTSRGMALVWAAIAAVVAVTLVAALIPTEAQQAAADAWRRYQAEQAAMDASFQASPAPTPTTPVATPAGQATGSPTAGVPTPGEQATGSPRGSVPTPAGQATGSPTAGVPDPGCSPAPRPVTVRPIDPRVRRAVNRQWRRIERWLRANAPRTYRTLRAPGRARTIAVAESQMGVDFPDDLRASLLRHNGSRGPLGFGWYAGAVNLGTREIRDSWRRLCRWDGSGPAKAESWNGRMIPFLYVTERDGENPAYAVADTADGKVSWTDGTISGAAPRLPSYYALMRTVADALEQGQEIGGRRPAVRRGVLRWDNVRDGNP